MFDGGGDEKERERESFSTSSFVSSLCFVYFWFMFYREGEMSTNKRDEYQNVRAWSPLSLRLFMCKKREERERESKERERSL